MRYLCCLVLLLVARVSVAQSAHSQKAIPNTVRVLVRAEAIAKLRTLFTAKRAANPDIQQLALSDEDNIAGLLGFSSLHVTRFAPFSAQHSAVFEDVREHLNPALFKNLDAAAIANDLLRTSEDKLSRWFTLEYSDSIAPGRVVFLSKASDLIELAEPVYPRYIQSQPPPNPRLEKAGGLAPLAKTNDPLLDSQYYLRMTNTLKAWNVQQCDSTMLVASIDQGIEFNHPDLAAAVWHNPGEMGTDAKGNDKSMNGIDDDGDGFVDDWTGWDFSGATGDSQRNSPTSTAMHGHHVAGILAATGNNGIGIAGVAHGAKLMVLKAQSNFCDDRINTGFEGIIYAADHGAKVISCSWGGAQPSQSEQDVIDYAFAKNTIVVCSAGNHDSPNTNYPSSYKHAVSVGSLDSDGTVTQSSTSAPWVTVSAPGQYILSTIYPNSINLCPQYFLDVCGAYDSIGYAEMCGTSMAAPQVAGAMALVWQHFPTLTNAQVIERLRATCDPIAGDPQPGFNGRGLINVYRALTDAKPHSVRIAQSSLLSQYGNAWLFAPDSGTLRITLHNLLDVVPQLHIDLDLITPDGQPSNLFSVTPKSFDLPSFPGGGMYSLPAITLQSESVMSAPADLLVRLTMRDTSVGYAADYEYVPMRVNPGYRTIRNNLTLSIGDNGSIGFRDAIRDEAGEGLRWEKPTKPLRPNAKSVLLAGGLLVARDTDHVVDPFGTFDYNAAGAAFTSVTPYMTYDSNGEENIRYYLGPGSHTGSFFTDNGADSIYRVGIRTHVDAYTLDSLAPNAAFVTYTFPPMQPFDAGLAMDWDFADYGNRDTAWFDQTDSIMFATRYKESGYPVAAMKFISNIPGGSSLAWYVMSSNGNDPGYGPDALGVKSAKYKLFQQNKTTGLHGDIAVLLGVHNMQARQADNSMSYVLALGESATRARYNLQCALAAINGEKLPDPPNDAVSTITDIGVQMWPNPTTGMLHISSVQPLHVSIGDMLGREVMHSNESDINLSTFPAGVYEVEVKSARETVHRRIVRE